MPIALLGRPDEEQSRQGPFKSPSLSRSGGCLRLNRWLERVAELAGTTNTWQKQMSGERHGADAGGSRTTVESEATVLEALLIPAHRDRGCKPGATEQTLERQLDRQKRCRIDGVCKDA